MMESSDKMCSIGEGDGKPLQYSCPENPMNSMKRHKKDNSLGQGWYTETSNRQLHGKKWDFPGGSDKESACSAGDFGSFPGSRRSSGQGMATHSSILAWKTPWTQEPGGLQSMGSQRGGHDWVTNTTLLLLRQKIKCRSLLLGCNRRFLI